MIRECDLTEITDGRLYSANDMVKIGCNDCSGCSYCCETMGDTILLDPYDIYQLTGNLSCSFEALLAKHLALQVVDGIILPNIKLGGEKSSCPFLNQEGRCSIHSFRPGYCRLFPLGRIYDNHSFRYIIQIHECQKELKTKVKIRKWLDIPNYSQYEQFITDWHYYLLDLQKAYAETTDEDRQRAISMNLLRLFYLTPYDAERDFYEQFYERFTLPFNPER